MKTERFKSLRETFENLYNSVWGENPKEDTSSWTEEDYYNEFNYLTNIFYQNEDLERNGK
jgi:hypothetical protein